MGGIPSGRKRKDKAVSNYVSWFEIPAVNFQQAVNFYNHIFGINMETNYEGEYAMAFFPASNGVGGSIVAGPGSAPSDTGPLLYLNAGNDLDATIERVREAGGRIVMRKTLISNESGYFAIFIDSEGNKLALHSNN